MIKYKLECSDCEIAFDSWFASSVEFEKLKKKKLLVCHICNSIKIDKTLMAPNVSNNKKNIKNDLQLDQYEKIKKTIKSYQKFIKENFKFVGENFAYEARSIHYDQKKKSKGIYGSASKKDLLELKEEGISAQMIPWVEDKDN
ncbi:DUF1178 family protein [Pelagibacterales bacterium SAG-MED21]|nr:DUF1178 family protein [Pelagibacterales bacterium SAG-MED21]